jgi:hypothetical protein
MKNNGTKTFDWDSRSGTHTLVAEGQVNRLTKKTKTVVLARVHNDPKGGHGDDLTVFRLEGDTLYVTDPHKGQDEDHAYTVTKNFELNTRYTLKIEVKNGKARYWYDGNPVEHASVTVKDPAAVSSAQRGATRVGAGGRDRTDDLPLTRRVVRVHRGHYQHHQLPSRAHAHHRCALVAAVSHHV